MTTVSNKTLLDTHLAEARHNSVTLITEFIIDILEFERFYDSLFIPLAVERGLKQLIQQPSEEEVEAIEDVFEHISDTLIKSQNVTIQPTVFYERLDALKRKENFLNTTNPTKEQYRSFVDELDDNIANEITYYIFDFESGILNFWEVISVIYAFKECQYAIHTKMHSITTMEAAFILKHFVNLASDIATDFMDFPIAIMHQLYEDAVNELKLTNTINSSVLSQK